MSMCGAMLPFASQPHGATLSDSAWRTPSEIPSRTRSVSAFLSGYLVRWRLRHLDLVAVLKTRE